MSLSFIIGPIKWLSRMVLFAGSMPRCIDVICRNEAVEYAKAGDKVVFTGAMQILLISRLSVIGYLCLILKPIVSYEFAGTVAVIADTSGLARAGETTVSGQLIKYMKLHI